MENVLLVLGALNFLGLLFLILKKSEKSNEEKLSSQMQQAFSNQREEVSKNFKENRTELTQSIHRLTETIIKNAKEDRLELRQTLRDFQEIFTKNVNTFNELQKEKFAEMKRQQEEMIKTTEIRLEKMRETVDEKLHKTLEERLGKSFELVTQQLLKVQKGLGEMQHLASGVGDLKKVLSNVKTRGVLGEIQLGNILEQILAPDQYLSLIHI